MRGDQLVECITAALKAPPADGAIEPGWGVTYTARVRVIVTAGGLPPLIREGSGAGHGNRFAEAQGLRRGSGPGP